MRCNFFVGQKVVMLNPDGCPPERAFLHPDGWPEHNGVYTVREVYPDITTPGDVGIFLNEFHGKVVPTLYGVREIGFCALMFRPVVDKPADISVFKKMLRPVLEDA